MSNGENIDNLTALYASYLHFICGTNLMHASPRAYWILVSLLAFFYKFMLFEFQSKMLQGLSIMRRFLRPVRVQLRCIHAGIIQLPIALSGCVSSTLRNSIQYHFSRTNMFTFILKVRF